MPDISVIIPLYNQADFIEEAIESLSRQTFKNFEVIVVNDGSTDNSLDVINDLAKKYKNLDIKVINQKNCGLSCARNRGIKESKSSLILPLDADDKLSKDALEEYLKAFKESKADIVIADTQNFGEYTSIGERWRANFLLLPYENQFNYCALYKKSVWQEVGGYKLNMDGGYEDWEFWISCYERGFKFHFVKKPLFYYRVKKESMLKEALKKDRYLKDKIILNHTALYSLSLVERARENIFGKDSSNKHFFYSDKEIDKKENLVILEGSFSGFQNFGDVLQLKWAISFYKNRGFHPIVLVTTEAIESREWIDRLYKYLDVDYILFYSNINYDLRDYNLAHVKSFKVDYFHIYGGGFLNRYWIDGYLNLAESVINFFDIKNFMVTGQQVDEKVVDRIESFFKKYPPFLFGCRDKISFNLLKNRISNVKYTFDDAFWELKNIVKEQIEFYENKKDNILLHLNISYYVVEDIKRNLQNYKNILKKIKQKFKNPKIFLITAYSDLKVKEIRDTLNTIQSLEDDFDFRDVEILDFSALAMNYHSSFEKLSIKIPKNSLMITSSYHLAMFAKVAKIPVFLFSKNEYYEQKREGLNLSKDFDLFLENKTADFNLRDYEKARKECIKEIENILDKKRDYRRYEYENDFKYSFPFYNKIVKYDISSEFRKFKHLVAAFKSLEKSKEWIDELDKSKNWLAAHAKNLEEENKRLLKGIEEQKSWIKELEGAKEWLNSQLDAFKEENSKILKDFENLKEWTKELESGKSWLENENKKKAKEIEIKEQKIKDLEKKLQKFEENVFVKALIKSKLIKL